MVISLPILLTLSATTAAIAGAAYFACRHQWRNLRREYDLMAHSAQLCGYGYVAFDKTGAFISANAFGRACLTVLSGEHVESCDRGTFFNALFDHAAEIDLATKNVLLESVAHHDATKFNEVVSLDDLGIILVEGEVIEDNGISVFVFKDINTGKKRESDILELSLLSKRLLHAMHASGNGVIVCEPSDKGNAIVFANEAFMDLVGEGQGQGTQELMWSALGRVFNKEQVADVVAALDAQTEAEVTLDVEKDGESRHYSLALNPVRDPDGTVAMMVGIITDITLIKQREAAVYQAQKIQSLGQLSAGIAHDFNNILSIIGGYATMGQKKCDPNDDSDSDIIAYFTKIHAASQRGAGLTQKMLTFGRHKVVQKRVVDVNKIVTEQKELVYPLMRHNIDLKITLPYPAVFISGSEDSLGQIIMNLSLNARDAMEAGGDLNIVVSRVERDDMPQSVKLAHDATAYVCISVADSGTGIDGKTMAKIFDPFFSTKDEGKGTGLGLSLVYGLMNEMGGALDVFSTLGEGTTFFCYFPEEQAPLVDAISAAADPENALQGRTILVVDDEPDLLDIVRSTLEDAGATVLTAPDGNHALDIVDNDDLEEISVMLTDVIMPYLDGLKLAEMVSSLRPDVMTIFMSGYPARGDMTPVDLPEDVLFIAKPVDYASVVGAILGADDCSSNKQEGMS